MTVAVIPMPRVTEILAAAGLGPDLSGIDPAILDAAARRGTAAHQAIEAHHYGLLDDEARAALSDEVRGRLEGYEKFLKDTGHTPIVSEVEVRHPAWRYVGHVDRVGWATRTVRSIDDWKCVTTVDVRAVARQLGAYRLAWNSMRPAEAVTVVRAIQLLPGDYRIVDEALRPLMREAEQEFLAALVCWRARQHKEA